jgi:hypothetical protein
VKAVAVEIVEENVVDMAITKEDVVVDMVITKEDVVAAMVIKKVVAAVVVIATKQYCIYSDEYIW